MTATKIISHRPARGLEAIKNFKAKEHKSLEKIGIHISGRALDKMHKSALANAMDSVQPAQTTASIATPVQFLQAWAPGFVHVVTKARKIDELIGLTMLGKWHDEQVVQGVLEHLGAAQPYGDYTNVPTGSWNTNFIYRTIVRMEQGMRIGVLETERSSEIRVDNSAEKRIAAARELEIQRNAIGFVGFNNGNNNTYGFLNDPNLPSYQNVPNNAAATSTQWANKTFLEITHDLQLAYAQLQNQSGDLIDPFNDEITLGVATASVVFLNTVSDFGISVRDWISKTYPKTRIVSAPELNAANGTANVFYLFAEKFEDDNSTDGGSVFMQAVQTKFMVLGVNPGAKGYEEDFSNATAGTMIKRPWAVVRYSGI